MNLNLSTSKVFLDIQNAMAQVDENGERKYQYIILKGSSRSSKTYSMIDTIDLLSRSLKGARTTVWRDNKALAARTIFSDMRTHLTKTGRWNVDNRANDHQHFIRYASGSVIEMQGTDNPTEVQGMTSDFVWINEPYDISQTVFDDLAQRTNAVLFIDLNPREGHWSEILERDPRTIVLHSTFRDNPFISASSRYKILSYQPLISAEAIEALPEDQRIEHVDKALKGDLSWVEPSHRAEVVRCISNERVGTADKYRWDVYGLGVTAERPNRIFNWKPIAVSEFAMLKPQAELYAVDWGQVDAFAIIHIKYYDGALYVRELNYLSENQLRAQWAGLGNPIRGVDEDEGVVKRRFRELSLPFGGLIVCDNNRPGKIRTLRRIGYERAVAAVKGRVLDGIGLLLDLDVYYSDDSENIKEEQELYSRKTDRYGVVLEEPEDNNNHTIDAIRYGAEKLRQMGIIQKV